MGNLYFRGSKDFGYIHKTWWYSIDPKVIEQEDITFIVLAADTKGIFLIPSEKFFAYRNRHPVGAVKGGREDFTVIRNGNWYFRRESKCEEEDLTMNFFIQMIYPGFWCVLALRVGILYCRVKSIDCTELYSDNSGPSTDKRGLWL